MPLELSLIFILFITLCGLVFFIFKFYSLREDIFALKEKILNKKKKIISLENEIIKTSDIKNKIEKEYTSKLFKLVKSNPEEIKIELRKEIEKNAYLDLESLERKLISNVTEGANRQAAQMVSLAIQRCSSKVSNDHTASVIKINDEDKGKLIGKNGRNIQWLEKTLGVELVIDETPGSIIISGYSSIRKHLAKLTIDKLLVDGRVNPSLIEEKFKLAQKQMDKEIEQFGKNAVESLGIFDFDIKLIRLIGRLKFRSSFGQSILNHSLEMARLAGLLADEINIEYPNNLLIDKEIAIKGALLHDIGKSIDEDMNPKGNHIEIGEKICDMFNLDWRIKKCITSHHTTGGDHSSYYDQNRNVFCIEACIVDACDNISGGRVGARKEEDKNYSQRIKGLENIAKSIEGVTKSWIMKGSKELWVFFDAQEIDTGSVRSKVKEIAKLIDQNIKTPSEIKVIGFREDRIVEFSR